MNGPSGRRNGSIASKHGAIMVVRSLIALGNSVSASSYIGSTRLPPYPFQKQVSPACVLRDASFDPCRMSGILLGLLEVAYRGRHGHPTQRPEENAIDSLV